MSPASGRTASAGLTNVGDVLPEALVLLNPLAGGTRSRERWARAEATVRAVARATVVELDAAGTWRGRVEAALEAGVWFFIAAGGDGTVHALVEALVLAPRRPRLDLLTLGAVGLGSSNDFHKPVTRRVGGVPVRLGPGVQPRDVGVVRAWTGARTRETHCFVVSASVGVVAEANHFFSNGDPFQGWLRGRWTTGAILNAARHAIARHCARPARLRIAGGGRTRRTDVTNLSVSKTPYVSGSFRYDVAVEPADGRLLVCLCEGMTRGRAVRALVDLARSRFAGRAGRVAWQSPRAALLPDEAVTLELDGETCIARRVAFGVLPERIQVCR
jgi:diacylglycerol kinase family enzyme